MVSNLFPIGSSPLFISPFRKTGEMAVTPNYEALRALASLSVDEEFCQKIGGKVFGYSGDPTLVYQSLCQQFSLLIDDMVGDLHTIKAHIPFATQRTTNVGGITEIGQAVS